jgi:curved DNA-binding protein CbpA
MFIALSDALYQEIGISSGATAAEIKRAYRVKAKRVHPDGGGSADEFTRLGRAYRVLSDPVRRLAYDRTGRVDDATGDVRSIALEMIGSFIDQVIESVPDELLPDIDVLELMRTHFGQLREKAQQGAQRPRAKAKKFERLATRFCTKAADDPIKRILDRRRDQLGDDAERILAEIAKVDAVSEILKGYSFRIDASDRSLSQRDFA